MKEFTKEDIKNIAIKIHNAFDRCNIHDVTIYYNNRSATISVDGVTTIAEHIHPLIHNKYSSYLNIITVRVGIDIEKSPQIIEDRLIEFLNNQCPKEFEFKPIESDVLDLWAEMYCIYNSGEIKIHHSVPEYTEIEIVGNRSPHILENISTVWDDMCYYDSSGAEYEHLINEGFEFTWRDKRYFMRPINNYKAKILQKYSEAIQGILESIECTDIIYRFDGDI